MLFHRIPISIQIQRDASHKPRPSPQLANRKRATRRFLAARGRRSYARALHNLPTASPLPHRRGAARPLCPGQRRRAPPPSWAAGTGQHHNGQTRPHSPPSAARCWSSVPGHQAGAPRRGKWPLTGGVRTGLGRNTVQIYDRQPTSEPSPPPRATPLGGVLGGTTAQPRPVPWRSTPGLAPPKAARGGTLHSTQSAWSGSSSPSPAQPVTSGGFAVQPGSALDGSVDGEPPSPKRCQPSVLAAAQSPAWVNTNHSHRRPGRARDNAQRFKTRRCKQRSVCVCLRSSTAHRRSPTSAHIHPPALLCIKPSLF